MPKTVYVKVFENRFVLKLLEVNQKPVTVIAPNSFTTKRLLVGDFTSAEVTLKNGLKKLLEGRWFAANPSMVIYPMEMVDGGLTQVKQARALISKLRSRH